MSFSVGVGIPGKVRNLGHLKLLLCTWPPYLGRGGGGVGGLADVIKAAAQTVWRIPVNSCGILEDIPPAAKYCLYSCVH